MMTTVYSEFRVQRLQNIKTQQEAEINFICEKKEELKQGVLHHVYDGVY